MGWLIGEAANMRVYTVGYNQLLDNQLQKTKGFLNRKKNNGIINWKNNMGRPVEKMEIKNCPPPP